MRYDTHGSFTSTIYPLKQDKDGNPPGIVRDEEVDPLPPLFKKMIKRMVRWHVLPTSCVPDSCIVNIYDEGDCIPPHIDHHDFVRPFCTVSFLAECKILFGTSLKIVNPGEFSGPFSLPLPLGYAPHKFFFVFLNLYTVNNSISALPTFSPYLSDAGQCSFSMVMELMLLNIVCLVFQLKGSRQYFNS